MTTGRRPDRPVFLGGWKSLPVRVRFLLYFSRFSLRKKKYPLVSPREAGVGLRDMRAMLHKLRFCKSVRHRGRMFFSLSVPHWPSPAFDRMLVDGGLNLTVPGSPWKRHIDVAVLAVTRQCRYDCRHCYEHFNLGDEDVVPVSRWQEVVEELQAMGVSVLIFSGGEPMLRYRDVLQLIAAADIRKSDVHLHTSGHAVTRERANELSEAGLTAAGVGLDDHRPEFHDRFRGYQGAYPEAIQAVEAFKSAGIFTYLNLCPTKELIRDGGLRAYMELARKLGIGAVRILEPKPCGGYLNEDSRDLISEEDKEVLALLLEQMNLDRRFRDFPLLCYDAFAEAPERLGCLMGGLGHFSIDSLGNVLPCVFLPVSFGNILHDNFRAIYQRMREAVPGPLRIACPMQQLGGILQGKETREGSAYPVPYEEVEEVWRDMIAPGLPSNK